MTSTDTARTAPAKGEFCHRHFSWLCQAGQGQCQREADPQPVTVPCECGDPNCPDRVAILLTGDENQ